MGNYVKLSETKITRDVFVNTLFQLILENKPFDFLLINNCSTDNLH